MAQNRIQRRRMIGCAWRCLPALLTLWTATAAQPEASDALLSRLSDNLGGIQTLDTAFVQEKHLALFDQAITLSGHIYMAKPDRLAWHVTRPVRYTLIMDGRSIRQWDADSGQETRISLQANPAMQVAADQMRQWFAGNYLRLRADYRIGQDSEAPVRLTFEPREANPASGFIERVTVVFTEDERYLHAISIVEQGGDRSEIRFHDTRLDQELPAQAWELRTVAESE